VGRALAKRKLRPVPPLVVRAREGEGVDGKRGAGVAARKTFAEIADFIEKKL
jgi:hypothetical protein